MNNDLLNVIGNYAIKKGEAWRVGEGAEIMDAYEAACHAYCVVPVDVCEHVWVSARNEVVESGEICAKLCGAIRAEQEVFICPSSGHVTVTRTDGSRKCMDCEW